MTTEVVRTQQLGSLQVLRALAALTVTFDHTIYLFITHLHLTPPFTYVAFGRFGVQLFFVISGFVMVYASVKHSPTFGGTLVATPPTPSGAIAVVPLRVLSGTGRGTEVTDMVNAVAVVADNTWKAMRMASSISAR